MARNGRGNLLREGKDVGSASSERAEGVDARVSIGEFLFEPVFVVNRGNLEPTAAYHNGVAVGFESGDWNPLTAYADFDGRVLQPIRSPPILPREAEIKTSGDGGCLLGG
jgi:hypothetical protein